MIIEAATRPEALHGFADRTDLNVERVENGCSMLLPGIGFNGQSGQIAEMCALAS